MNLHSFVSACDEAHTPLTKRFFFLRLFKFHCFITFSIILQCAHTHTHSHMHSCTCTEDIKDDMYIIHHATIIFHFNLFSLTCIVDCHGLVNLFLSRTEFFQSILLYCVTCSAREYMHKDHFNWFSVVLVRLGVWWWIQMIQCCG